MTRERAKELAPIIAAYGEGEIIQCKHKREPDYWNRVVEPSWHEDYDWRIKPEPKKRPMTRDEVLGFLANTQGIVVRMDEGVWQLPSRWTFYIIQEYQWATIDTKGNIGEPHAFEVEE